VIKTLLVSALLLATQRETTTVEVVQVPVYVSANGASVSGLTKDNFELYVNGKRQTIDYFDSVDFSAPAAAPAPASASAPAPPPARDPRQRRMYVLLFDLVNSSPRAVARAQVAANDRIDAAGEADFFAVATYKANRGIKLMVPFTRDRRALHHAVERFSEASSGDPLRLALATEDLAQIVEPEKFTEAEAFTYLQHDAAKELAADQLRRIIGDEVEDLSELADRLAPLEGYRHVVLFTGGFAPWLLHGIGAANTVTTPRFGGPNMPMNRAPREASVLGTSDPRITHALKEMYGHFTASGVFLDCIDLEGLRLSMSSTHDTESLSTLARETGGDVILNRNDLHAALQTLTDAQRIVYTLSFHAHDTGRARNNITVKLRNAPAGATMTYRPAYSKDVPKASGLDGLRLADIVENDIPQNGLPLSLHTATAGDKTTLDIEVPAREILALAGEPKAHAEALIYIYSGRQVAAFRSQRIDLDGAKLDVTRPLHLVQDFQLPPGQYTAKVLLRVDGNDALGFARAAIE
jgi:VWFA-related protein